MFNSTLWFQPNYKTILFCLYCLCFGVFRVVLAWPVLGCYQRLGGSVSAILWWFDSQSFNPTMVMRWHALWCVWIIDCYCFPVFLCEAEVYVYEIPNLTIFESSISYIWFAFQSLWEDRGFLNGLFLMMSCCDMFDLTILESSISIYFGILYGCSLRTNGYCDLFWDMFWFLIKNHWILWFIIDAFSCR